MTRAGALGDRMTTKPQILGFGQFGLGTMASTFRFWGLTILWENCRGEQYKTTENIQQCLVFFIGWYCSRAIVRFQISRLDRLWKNCSRQGICKQMFSEIHRFSLCCRFHSCLFCWCQDFTAVCFVSAKISLLAVPMRQNKNSQHWCLKGQGPENKLPKFWRATLFQHLYNVATLRSGSKLIFCGSHKTITIPISAAVTTLSIWSQNNWHQIPESENHWPPIHSNYLVRVQSASESAISPLGSNP